MSPALLALWRLFQISALIAGGIYLVLLLGEWLFPQFFPTKVDLGLLAMLFAVGFVPRMLTWALDQFLAYRKKRRRRGKT